MKKPDPSPDLPAFFATGSPKGQPQRLGMPVQPYPWYKAWWNAVTKPSVSEYERMAANPKVDPKYALLWIFLVTTISLIVFEWAEYSLYPVLGIRLSERNAFLRPAGVRWFIILAGYPLAGVGAFLGIWLLTSLSNGLAFLLDGKGEIDPLLYLVSAYTAPMMIVIGVFRFFAILPYIGLILLLINVGLSFYMGYLNVIAIKAVHRLNWGKAFLSSVFVTGTALLYLYQVYAFLWRLFPLSRRYW